MVFLRKLYSLAFSVFFRLLCCGVSFCVCMVGCSSRSFLPSSKDIFLSQWKSYDRVSEAFQQIKPYETDLEGLKKLGFSPDITPNIQILNHLDIMQRFIPNQSITLNDLDPGVKECLAAQEECQAYEIFIKYIDSDRYGNVLLDLFNFRRKIAITGWEFRAIVVLNNNLVVYKLCGGKPRIDEFKEHKNPLGPLQHADRILWQVAQ